MTWRACPREPEVVRATRHAEWPAELAAHVASCDACREAARLAAWLQTAASESLPEPPDPAPIWGRAALAREVARRQELARRAAGPALWFQRVAGVVAAAATAVWIATADPALWRGIELPSADALWRWSGWPASLDGPPLLALLGAALAAAYFAVRTAIDRLARP